MLTGVVFAALAATAAQALPSKPVASPLSKLELHKRYVDTRFPYTGPAVPVGDWVRCSALSAILRSPALTASAA